MAVRDPGAHRAAMSMTASYLMRSEQRENWEWVLDSSRRARGFTLYAAIRSLGRDGVQASWSAAALARRMADRLREAEGVEVSTTSSSTRCSSASATTTSAPAR